MRSRFNIYIYIYNNSPTTIRFDLAIDTCMARTRTPMAIDTCMARTRTPTHFFGSCLQKWTRSDKERHSHVPPLPSVPGETFSLPRTVSMPPVDARCLHFLFITSRVLPAAVLRRHCRPTAWTWQVQRSPQGEHRHADGIRMVASLIRSPRSCRGSHCHDLALSQPCACARGRHTRRQTENGAVDVQRTHTLPACVPGVWMHRILVWRLHPHPHQHPLRGPHTSLGRHAGRHALSLCGTPSPRQRMVACTPAVPASYIARLRPLAATNSRRARKWQRTIPTSAARAIQTTPTTMKPRLRMLTDRAPLEADGRKMTRSSLPYARLCRAVRLIKRAWPPGHRRYCPAQFLIVEQDSMRN
jgi:hypothetical protein